MNLRPGTLGRLDDGERRLVDDLVVVRADANADPLLFRLLFFFRRVLS